MTMDREELAAWLRLQCTPGVGNASARQLLAAFGLPQQIFAQSAQALRALLSPSQVEALLTPPAEYEALLAKTWKWLQVEPDTRRVLTLGDAAYPQCLLQIEDPPLLLYGLGMAQVWSQNLLNQPRHVALAVVGSRNPTPQGAATARQFALALARSGLSIVSGLALGVDGAAHEGALEGAALDQVATIAVVGTGLDRVYPREHRVLAHRIAQRGVLLSEYALGTAPLAANFPRRNRLLSGLSRGTLVVEAALQSGSLITARRAVEQGREVFAIPGSIHSPQSRGCHALIREGAKLVERAQDILEELQLTHLDAGAASAAAVPDPATRAETRALLRALGHAPCSLDALQAHTGLATEALLAQLLTLELQGDVARLPGGMFQRLQRA